MWLKRLQRYESLGNLVIENYRAIHELPLSKPKHLEVLHETVEAQKTALIREIRDYVAQAAPAPSVFSTAFSLLEALQTNSPYRSGSAPIDSMLLATDAINKMREDGDIGLALVMQEARVYRFWKQNNEEERLTFSSELQKYVEIYEETAGHWSSIRPRQPGGDLSMPALHNLLLNLPKGASSICPAILTKSELQEEKDMLGRTLLHLALDLEMGWGYCEEPLVIRQAETKDGFGRLPLHIACIGRVKNRPLIFLLAALTEDTNAVDNYGRTAMHNAAIKGHHDVIDLLFESQNDVFSDTELDPDIKDKSGMTPLAHAMRNRDFKMMSMLWNNDADSNIADNQGRTLLSHAAEKGEHDMVSGLLNHGLAEAGVCDHRGRSPLSYAAEHGHEGIVAELVFEDDEPTKADVFGRTPLMWAAEGAHDVVIADLLDEHNEEAYVNARDNVTGQTALFYATRQGAMDTVEILLENNADMTIRCHDGRLAIDHAVKLGDEDIVELFFDCDTEGAMRTEMRRLTNLAEANGHELLVDILMERFGGSRMRLII